MAEVLAAPPLPQSRDEQAHVAQLAGRPLDFVLFRAVSACPPAVPQADRPAVPDRLLGLTRPDLRDAPRAPRVRGGAPAPFRRPAGCVARPNVPVFAFQPTAEDQRAAIAPDVPPPSGLLPLVMLVLMLALLPAAALALLMAAFG